MNRIAILLIVCFPLQSMAKEDTLAVKSIEGITSKMLELISGEKDAPRDWDEFRNLFLPTAQLMSINPNGPMGKQIKAMNLEEFVRNVGPLYKRDGFEEIVTGLEINEFNGIANVFQSFYCKNLIGTYENRGINSYQLVYADDRWWIANTTFTNESEYKQVPNAYLFKEHQKER